ncbi:MAG: DNA adenine methylase [Gemmatimonadaceae bacterium]
MRYIGNKTRLLPFILDAVDLLRLPAGTVHDAFAGTAAVGRALKERGWRVGCSDIMTYSYVYQRAYVVARRAPTFASLRAQEPELRRALRSPHLRRRVASRGGGALAEIAEYLSSWLEADPAFISAHFGPAGGRMYFTSENAARIDAIRSTIQRWRDAQIIGDDAFFILLAALLEAADRVANTAGVYAAYIKQWQPNALKPLLLTPRLPTAGVAGSTAHREDAARVARSLPSVDLLYIDPPYNARQYAGYYHVPEIIARGWFDEPIVLSGKTGLLAVRSQQSAWCSPRQVGAALDELLEATSARDVLVSYNSEGLLPAETLRSQLQSAAGRGAGRVRELRLPYRRYRADSDHAGRSYRADRVEELLYHVRRR